MELFNNIQSSYFLMSTEDEFLSEYSLECFKRLQFISGFSGSLAFCLFSKSGHHKLFVDGRYTIQAQKEVFKNFEVFSLNSLKENLKEKKIAIHTKTFNYKTLKSLEIENFEELEFHPIDEIWQREININYNVYNFNLSGKTKEEKLKEILIFIEENKAEAMFIFDLCNVNWLFNIRGEAFLEAPIAPFFAIVSKNEQKLISFDDIQNIKYNSILLPEKISYYCYNVLKNNCQNIKFIKEDFVEHLKSIKTESEIECIKLAQKEDTKALTLFANFLKSTSLEKETEFTLSEKLLEFRKSVKGFTKESFSAIVGFNENSAIIHYRAKKETAKKITQNGLLLVDSGAHYYDEKEKICGTTDVTRTFLIGKATEKQKRVYTLVLKGYIALAKAIFARGTTGAMLDVLARQFLHQNGLNYEHGTGHGVGYFLSVHEGPCGFSKFSHTVLKEGMIISNEPGCYFENEFGVRYEGLLLVKKHPEFENFLCFEELTNFPPEKQLLDFEILTEQELKYLESF